MEKVEFHGSEPTLTGGIAGSAQQFYMLVRPLGATGARTAMSHPTVPKTLSENGPGLPTCILGASFEFPRAEGCSASQISSRRLGARPILNWLDFCGGAVGSIDAAVLCAFRRYQPGPVSSVRHSCLFSPVPERNQATEVHRSAGKREAGRWVRFELDFTAFIRKAVSTICCRGMPKRIVSARMRTRSEERAVRSRHRGRTDLAWSHGARLWKEVWITSIGTANEATKDWIPA